MTDRESIKCPFCGSKPGEACLFPIGEAPMVDDGGTRRRVVHAARYAETLPSEQRQAFWAGAVGEYLTTELAAMDAAAVSGQPGNQTEADHG